MNPKEKQSQMDVLPGKIAAPVFKGQFPSQSEMADLTPDPVVKNSNLLSQEVIGEPSDQHCKGPVSRQVEERDN